MLLVLTYWEPGYCLLVDLWIFCEGKALRVHLIDSILAWEYAKVLLQIPCTAEFSVEDLNAAYIKKVYFNRFWGITMQSMPKQLISRVYFVYSSSGIWSIEYALSRALHSRVSPLQQIECNAAFPQTLTRKQLYCGWHVTLKARESIH